MIQVIWYQGLRSIFYHKSCLHALHVILSWHLLPHDRSLYFLQEKRNRR